MKELEKDQSVKECQYPRCARNSRRWITYITPKGEPFHAKLCKPHYTETDGIIGKSGRL